MIKGKLIELKYNITSLFNNLSILLRLFLILALSYGCSPKYETTYKLHPIEDSAGKDCLSACDFSKDVCIKEAFARRRRCQYWSEVNYTRCQSRRVLRYSRRTNSVICVANCACFRQICRSGAKTCKSDYRDCHIGCGGKITKEKKCIKFCDEAEADSSKVIDARELR